MQILFNDEIFEIEGD